VMVTASGRDLTPPTSGTATVADRIRRNRDDLYLMGDTLGDDNLGSFGGDAMPWLDADHPVAIDVLALVEVLMACTVLTASPLLPT